MCSKSILSLSKIVHQIWRDHPFNQRNRTTERTVSVGVRDDRDMGEGVGKNLKKGSGVKGNMKWGLHKIWEVSTLLLWKKLPIPHYKTNSLTPPISRKKFPSPPHYNHFWKISSPLYEGVQTMVLFQTSEIPYYNYW